MLLVMIPLGEMDPAGLELASMIANMLWSLEGESNGDTANLKRLPSR